MISFKRIAAGAVLSGSLALTLGAALPASAADISINIGVNAWNAPPPPLPVYDQPMIPGPGYIWTPGYWAVNARGYYWMPGTWVMPPFVGALWTPGYWGYVGNTYRWHPGYWGRQVGYYGGINYGFGYLGSGYQGGYWKDKHFHYNRAVNRIDTRRITHVYHRKVVINHVDQRRISYHGGKDGIQRRPTDRERQIDREHRRVVQEQQRSHQKRDAAPAQSQRHARDHGSGQQPGTSNDRRPTRQAERRDAPHGQGGNDARRDQAPPRRVQEPHQQQARQQQQQAQRQQQARQQQQQAQRQQQARQQQQQAQRQQQARQQQQHAQRQQQARQQQQHAQRQQQARPQQERRGGAGEHGGGRGRDH